MTFAAERTFPRETGAYRYRAKYRVLRSGPAELWRGCWKGDWPECDLIVPRVFSVTIRVLFGQALFGFMDRFFIDLFSDGLLFLFLLLLVPLLLQLL